MNQWKNSIQNSAGFRIILLLGIILFSGASSAQGLGELIDPMTMSEYSPATYDQLEELESAVDLINETFEPSPGFELVEPIFDPRGAAIIINNFYNDMTFPTEGYQYLSPGGPDIEKLLGSPRPSSGIIYMNCDSIRCTGE